MPKVNITKVNKNISEIMVDNPKIKGTIKWVNIINAGRKEIDYLKKNYNFNIEHLRASISTVFSQRPMLSQEPGYFFIVLHFPIYEGGRIIAAEIEFFISHGYLITVHNNNIPALRAFYEACKSNPKILSSYKQESSIILLYEILNRLIQDCYTLIDKNSIRINQVEDKIFSRQQKEAVSLILNLRRSIINLRKILQNHKNILLKLTEVESSLVPQEDIQKHYDELVDHSDKIWSMLDNQREMVEVLDGTNESLLNDQMTSIMKTLTVFSVIVFPLTLLAAIFGMNVPQMPLVADKFGFAEIMAVMAILSLFMLLFFKKKKWL